MPQDSLDFILHHLGEAHEEYFGSVAPPLLQSSNFVFPTVAALREGFRREQEVPVYTRGSNPTTAILRKKLAALAGSDDALIFSSGAMAVAAAVLSQIKSGDHVLCVARPYSWTFHLLSRYLIRFGIETTFVEGTDTSAFEANRRSNTRLVFLESPNSLTLECQDLKTVAGWCKRNGLISIIDNSYSTSLGQKVLEMGIDIELHSGTKYYGGHSDLVAGVLLSRQEIINEIFRNEYMTLGGILSPHDAWLMLRSLRTLPIRLERSGQTALAMARWLETRDEVERIHYPGLESHPQYALAQEQMSWPGALLAVWFKADTEENMENFCNSLGAFRMAVSWGGYESLQIPAASFYEPGTADAERKLPWNFVRFYVGLEEFHFLQSAIERALPLLRRDGR